MIARPEIVDPTPVAEYVPFGYVLLAVLCLTALSLLRSGWKLRTRRGRHRVRT